jgi:bis(5'-nucleosyl)-tetraphosphatase (symmetrical)
LQLFDFARLWLAARALRALAATGHLRGADLQKIFIGDVQGCADELDELLDRAIVEYGQEFEAWIVGDVVNRGPDNLRALRRVRDLVTAGRAKYVLGNHEISLLATAIGLRSASPFDSFTDVIDAPDADDWIEWLRRRPLAESGRLGDQRFAMVHASTHPAWSLEELAARARRAEARLSDPDRSAFESFLALDPAEDEERDTLGRLTRCRTVAADGRWSSELPSGKYVAWHRAFSLEARGYGVVYGHWALQGLHVAPWLRGLDTGCVHHGRGRDGTLTAWIPDPEARTPFDVPDGRFWQIPARRAYYAHRDA